MRLFLFNTENRGTLSLRALLLLVALFKRNSALVVAANVVEWLHLVDTDNPVLAGECFLERAKLGSFGGESGATNAVLGLAAGEELVEVVVGHFVPFLSR